MTPNNMRNSLFEPSNQSDEEVYKHDDRFDTQVYKKAKEPSKLNPEQSKVKRNKEVTIQMEIERT